MAADEFSEDHNVIGIPAKKGNTGCQMGGWFRKEDERNQATGSTD